jgi:hypothetical protein
MRYLSCLALLTAALVVSPAADVHGAAAWRSAALQDSAVPGPWHATRIVVGESPPTSFVLRSIDDELFDLESAGGPLLLLFFRGTW